MTIKKHKIKLKNSAKKLKVIKRGGNKKLSAFIGFVLASLTIIYVVNYGMRVIGTSTKVEVTEAESPKFPTAGLTSVMEGFDGKTWTLKHEEQKEEVKVEQKTEAKIQAKLSNSGRKTKANSNPEIEAIIIKYSKKYGISPLFMLEMAKRESGLNPRSDSIVDAKICRLKSCNKGQGRPDGLCGSHGLYQILAVCHPKVSLDQMYDPEWSTDFACRNVAGGNMLWSAGRQMLKEGWTIR